MGQGCNYLLMQINLCHYVITEVSASWQLRLDAPASSLGAGSEIDSLEGPLFIADSAASFDGFSLCKERAALLKEERMRLWAANGNPEELERQVPPLIKHTLLIAINSEWQGIGPR